MCKLAFAHVRKTLLIIVELSWGFSVESHFESLRHFM